MWGQARGGAPAWGARGAQDAVISVLREAVGMPAHAAGERSHKNTNGGSR